MMYDRRVADDLYGQYPEYYGNPNDDKCIGNIQKMMGCVRNNDYHLHLIHKMHTVFTFTFYIFYISEKFVVQKGVRLKSEEIKIGIYRGGGGQKSVHICWVLYHHRVSYLRLVTL